MFKTIVTILIPTIFGINLQQPINNNISGLTPDINTDIFLSPTPTNTPTPTPTPTNTPTPKPTATPTPTPLPTPTTISYSSTDMDSWFEKYSRDYGVDRNLLYKIAVCESFLRPNAENKYYAGLFQFSTPAWKSTRIAMGLDANPDLRFNPEESIKTAAYKISVSGTSAWPNCVK